MMIQIKKIIALLVFSALLFSSCRVAETINIDESVLEANSNVANLIQRTSLNDGSNDNIIDRANCFNVKLPVTVIANTTQITINSDSDFDIVEAIFDASDTDTDTLQIIFPITIVLSDFTEIFINNQSEFDAIANTCNGENEPDSDIECIDFQFPINISIFNTVTEQTDQIVINSNRELHDFIRDLDNDDIVNISFPVTVILSDGSVFSTNDLRELEDAIEDAQDICDEDDDFDFNDDDCVGCSTNQLETLLTGCTDWTVDKLELNNVKLEDNYIGFDFNFFNDGTIIVVDGGTNHSGTWSSSGMGQNITVVIDIPTLPDFNASWTLHEIEDFPGQKKVDLRQSNDDRLRFESPCN